MVIPHLYSVKSIERILQTGEEPIIALCNDMNFYLCKYMRTSSPAYKLVCEIIGSVFAKCWELDTPDFAYVNIKDYHWKALNKTHVENTVSFGNRIKTGVVDINNTTSKEVTPSLDILKQLLNIALFDFWIANEDRNSNNANLMYDILNKQLISIDYGCILNTATFDFQLSQLTMTDSILYSELFVHLAKTIPIFSKIDLVEDLNHYFKQSLTKSKKYLSYLPNFIPTEWNVKPDIVIKKLNQLFDSNWIDKTWDNFLENFQDNFYSI